MTRPDDKKRSDFDRYSRNALRRLDGEKFPSSVSPKGKAAGHLFDRWF